MSTTYGIEIVRNQKCLEARQKLAREYLNRPDIDVAEVAYLLGYEDSNSFLSSFPNVGRDDTLPVEGRAQTTC